MNKTQKKSSGGRSSASAPAYPDFRRSPRLIRQQRQGKMEIEAAPAIGNKPEINWVTVLLPVIGMTLVSLIMTLFLSVYSMVFTIPMMLFGVIGTVVNYRMQAKKYQEKVVLLRERYMQYTLNCEEQLEEAVVRQREDVSWSNPSPEQCVRMAQERNMRLWERTRDDADFLTLRIGLGEEPIAIEIQTPRVGFVLEETEYTRVPEQLANRYRMVDNVPVLCDLLRTPCVGVVGQREQAAQMVRCMIVQAATHHGYDELKLVALFPEGESEQWAWLRWLPHCSSKARDIRYLACERYEASEILNTIGEVLRRRSDRQTGSSGQTDAPLPHYLFLVADPSLLGEGFAADLLLRNDPSLGVSCIFLAEAVHKLPRSASLVLEAQGEESRLYFREYADNVRTFRMDAVSAYDCDAFARWLAPLRLPEQSAAQLPSSVTFLQGYHIKKVSQLELGEYWAESCACESMSVPIGVRANGENFYFDIHEKVHGPHGLVAGMTGSGKTEMVQSWILSMAVQFSPQDVSFVLIDFKGTGMILPFLKLPHLAGTISDLDENISRNLIALRSELQRRKTLFDSAGVSKISDYLKLYRKGQVKEPLSYLFVVIDEYAEFKAKFPDFTGEINSLFRTGRSMGVSILLLTQNPAGVVSGESDTNVRFRWCLKVSNTGASKEVLGGHDDAAYITDPGRAYIRVGSDEVFEPIQSFYSGAPYEPNRKETDAALAVSAVALDGSRRQIRQTAAAGGTSRIAEIDAVVREIREYAARKGIPDARHIWQERMPGRIYLPQLIKDSPAHTPGSLAPIVGLLDDPANQIQRPFYLPLSSDGHVAVYGAPGSGKTTFLQTLAASLCMSYSPEEVNLYIMDFGGWSMGMFRDFPQVAAIANDNEEDRINAIAQAIDGILYERKELFSAEGVGSLEAYLRATGKTLPYIVLLLDNFAPVYSLYPKLEDFFIQLGRNAGSYGVYLVTTAGNTMALGYKLNQSIKTAVALQMTSSSDYSGIVGRTEGLVPTALPGRGLIREGYVLEFQTALPVRVKEGDTYLATIHTLGEDVQQRWGHRQTAQVSIMPREIAFGSVPSQDGCFALGLTVERLKPALFDPADSHHLLVSGLQGSGKTNLLCSLTRQMGAQTGWRVALFAEQADYERYRSCAGQAEMVCLEDGEAADHFLEELAAELTRRQEQRKSNPDEVFAPVCLMIDGYKRFFEAIAQQSVSRMRALVMMGAGLGVTVVVAEDAGKLSLLAQYKEAVLLLLAKGPALLLGGRALEHMAVELPVKAMEKGQALAPWEGWYQDKKTVLRMKLMKAE